MQKKTGHAKQTSKNSYTELYIKFIKQCIWKIKFRKCLYINFLNKKYK